MAPRKKLTWKTILPGCFRSNSSEANLLVSKQISSQRISLSELSNPESPISVNDFSHSIFNLHVFSLKELEMVTDKFSRNNFIGEGGFGRVYKGFVDDKLRPGLKAQPVAVKVLNLDGSQGHKEWLAEVIFLGQLKHPHLVNLIGYCCEDEHRLLVYEYLERGNLETQLFKRYSITLPWLARLKIAVGAAKGLSFLHEEQKPIIYRDFKASNILLDMEYNAKLSDFGLATDGPQGDKSHITTCVMGTEGYAAPEYIMTGHLTTRSDVFSFGVVLLELLTGRRSLDKRRPSREQNLVKWARPLLKDPHKLNQIMDPRLEGQFSTEGSKKAATLAYHCLSYHSKSRPNMNTVVKTLEPLLKLEDTPIGPFVYVVPIEARNNCHNDSNKEEENQIEVTELKNGDKIGENQAEMKQKKGCHRNQKRRRIKRRVKSLMSGPNYSDTALYKTLGSSLYSPRL